jgi:hypothetical protein
MSYFRNVDDGYSDPETIAAKYLVGRNASFEVALTLAEYAENIKSASGGNTGSSNFIQDIYIETGGERDPHCPEMSQKLLTKEGYETCDKIYLRYLNGESVFLLNPLSGNHNLITHLEIKDAPLVELITQRARLVCSTSHKVIKNCSDRNGTWFGAADEVLTFTDNCYQDSILDVIPRGEGKVLSISLEQEFIYSAGILSHNRKIEPGIGSS